MAGRKLTALSKNASGSTDGPQATIICNNPQTQEFMGLTVTLDLSPGPCDENEKINSLLNGTMTWHVNVQSLAPGQHHALRGCFSGIWQLVSGGVQVAQGQVRGTVGAGTHRAPLPTLCDQTDCEKCDSPEHLEAVLTGRVIRLPDQPDFAGADFCASVAGSQNLLPGVRLTATIEGVLVSPCQDD